MSDIRRNADRNRAIQAMMTNGEQLKTFYRFVANNPHIPLHDACQIVIERPNASVCFSFEEWNAQERRVTKGRKGIPYYDSDGNKYFVFDVADTHGENRYRRITQPVKKILDGLDLLNGTEIADSNRGDYRIMLSGVVTYLGQNDFLTENDEIRNRLIAEGVAYSLYSTTGFPKERGITLKGYPYGLQENADLFREVQKATEVLQQDINDAIYNKQNEVPVIDDIDEEYVSDEPVIPKADEKPIAQEEKSSVSSFYEKYSEFQKANPDSIVVCRLGDFYEVMGEKAEQAATILDLTLTGRNVGLPERVPMCGFPYHVADRYLGKLTESVSVVVVEPDAEPFKILSRDEARKTSELEELSPEESEELDRIFSEQEEAEEQPDYVGEIDTRFPIGDDYSDDDKPTDEEIEDNRLIAWVKPKKVEFKANSYTMDGTQAAVFAIADYPLRVRNAWGADVFNIPNTKVVLHVKPVDKFKAIKRIDKCIGEMETKQILSEKASEANSAETHRETMNALLDSLQTENESLLDVTLTITAYNYLDDDNYKKAVRRNIMTGNFKPSNLYGLQIEGFKSSAISPVSTLKNYERGINSSSLAAVFPFVRTFVMDDGGIMLGENKANGFPFIFNMWKRGNLYQNSNGMIIGKSGSGKSFFLKSLIANEWANDTRVIILDPEAEYLTLTKNLSGNLIDVGNAKEGRINPFHIYKILTEDGLPADPVVTFNTHLKMLESFFKIVFVGANSDVIELINNLAVEAYARKGIYETTDCTGLNAEDFPLFTDLLAVLREKNKEETDSLTLRDMRTAELYLQKFVNGRYSDIWNAPSTLKVDADLIDFNFQSLFANKNNTVANAQMLLVFRFIEQEVINAREANKSGKNLRTLIISDEAHLFIDAKFPIALDFFFSMSKRIRKYNGSFIPATQNIADWNANEELRSKTSAILKNSQYTFIFKLSAPDMKDVLDVYKAGDSFNQDEQRMIISAVTGQVFFIGSTELRTNVKITTGEYIKSLFEDKTGENYNKEGN